MVFFKKNKTLFFITMLLAILPFFWMNPGEMDLGGDGGRLYFYDPINFIKNVGLYYQLPSGTGIAEGRFFYLPFAVILVGLKYIAHSTYILIYLHNAIKIIVGFIAVYLIVKELIGKDARNSLSVQLASVGAGLFYLSSPAMIENYVRAIPTHNQVFLNPLMFYLLMRFFLTHNIKYVWAALIISVILANNFSYQAAPPFFAFYPLALLFISIYCIFIKHVTLPWKKISTVFLLFLGLHSFHLIPEINDLTSSGSNTNTRVFDAQDIKEQVGYFYGVLHIPKVSFHLFTYSLTKELAWVSVVVPLIVLLGLLLNKKREKTIILTALFFLLTVFLVTGKTTNIGVKLYETLFYIPGFSMFRNFYGQWQFVFYFFYALLFGLSFFSVIRRLKSHTFSRIFFIFLALYFIGSSWNFINGNLVNPIQQETDSVKTAFLMDPKYEETLDFIRSIPDDSKILILPFTDSYDQVIYGINNGAYVGSSTIGQLTGKKDFAGYSDMMPYSDIFWELSREKEYESVQRLLGLLNIRYIYHNSDVRIYDSTFQGRPYSSDYVRKYMPNNQREYGKYIDNLTSEKIFGQSFYNIYKVDDKGYLPHFYTAYETIFYHDDPILGIYNKASAFFKKGTQSERPVYVENESCKVLFSKEICDNKKFINNNSPKIQFEKINPIKYRVKVFEASEPYILVFSEAFNSRWKVFITNKKPEKGLVIQSFFDGAVGEGKHKNIFIDKNIFETVFLKSISEKNHVTANGYANAWFIRPQDVDGENEYELIVELTSQRIFYVSLLISTLVFIGFLAMCMKFLQQKK